MYLTTRHTWNKSTHENARLCVPETEMYEMMYIIRRRIISFVSKCRQGVCDEVMQTALQVPTEWIDQYSC